MRVYGLEMPRAVHRRWSRDRGVIELAAPLLRHIRLDGVAGIAAGTWAAGDVIVHADVPVTVTGPHGDRPQLAPRRRRDRAARRRDAATSLVDGCRAPRSNHRAASSAWPIDAGAPGRGRGTRRRRTTRASRLSRHAYAVIRRKGFPAPVGQHWIRDRGFAARLDFAYPAVKVYLEGDGFGFHRIHVGPRPGRPASQRARRAGLDRPALHVADVRRRDRGQARLVLRPHDPYVAPAAVTGHGGGRVRRIGRSAVRRRARTRIGRQRYWPVATRSMARPPFGSSSLALVDERADEDDALALLARDLRPVVGVGRVRQVLVLLVLLLDRVERSSVRMPAVAAGDDAA